MSPDPNRFAARPRRAPALVAAALCLGGCGRDRPAPPAPVPGPEATVASKGRVQFKGGRRYANDLARGLSLPRGELCRELSAYDCVDAVHVVTLGGVSPYDDAIYRPSAELSVPTANAVDRLALGACEGRAGRDFASPQGAVIFGELARGGASPPRAAIVAAVGGLYEGLLGRAPGGGEVDALASLYDELAADLGADAPRRFATLACYAVASSEEALFYLVPTPGAPMTPTTSRRRLLQALALGAGATALGPAHPRALRAQGRPDDRRFLIVLAATGGASIIDGPLALRASESSAADAINCFPDGAVATIAGTDLRAVRHEAPAVGAIPYAIKTDQTAFVEKYGRDLLAVTATSTSVNHNVAQRRAVTGNEAWGGRTLQEAVAAQHGRGALLPNVHLVTGTGFTERGSDPSLPAACYGQVVADPLLWPLSLHGSRGTPAGDRPDLVARARALRDGRLQPASPFSRAFGGGAALERWRALRGAAQAEYEGADLITKLTFAADGERFALGAHGLASSPEAAALRARFPAYATDPLEAQAALAYLLIRNDLSAAVTLGASFGFSYDGEAPALGESDQLPPGSVKNLPIAFDFSHTAHRAAQAFMWDRIYRVAGGLIDLLRAAEFGGGQSYWDRTLIYVATDFGRTKRRPSGAAEFGSGHDLNNGYVLLSPLVPGGRVLGGIDPQTGLTYGFDPASGRPEPGRTTSEREVYAGILHALDVDTAGSGLPDVRAMRRAG